MAGNLTSRVRDLLIEHMDGKLVPVIRNTRRDSSPDIAIRTRLTTTLINHGWIRYATPKRAATVITEAGRGVISAALADWADALDRANFGSPTLPRKDASSPDAGESSTADDLRPDAAA